MAKTFGELTLVRKTTTEKDFTCVKYIEDGTKVVAGNSDGLVRVYESGTLELLQTLGTPKESDSEPANPVTDISNIPPRNPKFSKFFIATYTNGYVKLWNTDKGKAVTTLDEQRQTLSVAFSPNQPNFVTVGDDAIIYLYDEQTMSVIQTLRSSESGKIDGHTARVFTAEFHPKYTYDLLTGGWDNTVQFWDVRKPTSVRYISGPHICGNGIVFKPGSGKEIITASYQKENALQKWDYSTGKLLVNFEPDIYKCMFYCAKWVEQDFLLTGGSDPSIFKLMHLPSNNTIGYVRSQQTGVYSIDYKIIRAATPKLEKEESITTKSSIKTITSRERTSSRIDDFTIVRTLICTGRYLFEIDANLDAK